MAVWDSPESQKKEVRAWAKWLRSAFPVSRRVIVYICDRGTVLNENNEECDGYYYTTDKSFVILLPLSPDWKFTMSNLVEEWVHLRRYPNDQHDHLFDLEFGEIMRAIRGIENGA